MASNDQGGAWGFSTHPTVLSFAGVILLALIALALLRYFFGSIRIEAGTK